MIENPKNSSENQEASPDNGIKPKKKKKAIEPDIDKEKAKLDKFDVKGVQVLLRTVSKNHYNLLRMVDNKASIILTMNSIIISLLMGVIYIVPEIEKDVLKVVARILIDFGMLSMVFALIGMLPHRYLGRNYRKSSYQGSLYAGNFASQPLEDFKAEFERILSTGSNVYNEMIEDTYFLGKAIYIKQKMILLSVLVFLVGLVSSMAYSMLMLVF